MLLNFEGSMCTGHMTLPEVDKDETRGYLMENSGHVQVCSP